MCIRDRIRNDVADSGIRVITEGLKLYQACQSKLGVPKWMTYVAEGYQYTGQHDQTLLLLDSAKAEMNNMGNEYFRAEWARVRAESLSVIAQHDLRQSEELFEKAISLSRSQRAKLFELTATIGLARLQQCRGQGDVAISQLRQVVSVFSGQASFAHLVVAKQLVKEIENQQTSA